MATILKLVQRKLNTKTTGRFLLFNTMPKSASVFISQWLARGLPAQIKPISYGYFPNDMVDFQKLKACSEGSVVCQEHLDPSPMNRHLLRSFVRKMVVHVRDPRQATLSWSHHVDRLQSTGNDDDLLACVYPQLPLDYFTWDFGQRIDWQIDNHLPLLIEWCQKWLAAQWDEFEILFTQYEDFRADAHDFIERLLTFFEIPRADFDFGVRPDPTMKTHFRCGQAEEWRTVFTDEQVKRAGQLIPQSLVDRFGWTV